MTCEHAAAADPRKHGTCVKCGRPIPAQARRDRAFEETFLEEVVQIAQRLTGNASLAYPHRVRQRLELGEQRYGSAWRDRDCISEVLEETPDLAGYGVLELQRLEAEGVDPQLLAEVRLDLLAVAAYGCAADFFALRAARRLAGLE